MEAKSTVVVDGRRDRTDEPARVGAVPRADIEALNRQRIRFNGFFTGPTW
jgi:hypothetical protein